MGNLQSVLIYSDNKDTRQIYDTVAALGGFRAVYKDKKLALSKDLFTEKFNVIIIEISKPAISEVQFVDFIHDAIKSTPILIVSQFFMDTKNILFGNKVKDYLFNPITTERMLDAIRKIVVPQSTMIDIAREIGTDTLDDSRKLSMLLEISRSLSTKSSINEVLHSIINIATETFTAERATVFILSVMDKELVSKAGTGLRENEIRLPIHRGVAGYVADTGISQVVNDPYSHPKFDKEIDYKTGFTTRNILCVPIRNIRGQIVGVFQVLNKINGSFTLGDEAFLSAIATNTGIALENAALNEKLKEQLSVSKSFSHELYSALEKASREARNNIINEIVGFLTEEFKNKDIQQIIDNIKKSHPADEKLLSQTDRILTIHNKVLFKISEFLTRLKV
jgi:putative methionine-R-sulfoxide reductase with GAF domain